VSVASIIFQWRSLLLPLSSSFFLSFFGSNHAISGHRFVSFCLAGHKDRRAIPGAVQKPGKRPKRVFKRNHDDQGSKEELEHRSVTGPTDVKMSNGTQQTPGRKKKRRRLRWPEKNGQPPQKKDDVMQGEMHPAHTQMGAHHQKLFFPRRFVCCRGFRELLIS